MKLFSRKLSVMDERSIKLRLVISFFGESMGAGEYILFNSKAFSLMSAIMCSSKFSLVSFHLYLI